MTKKQNIIPKNYYIAMGFLACCLLFSIFIPYHVNYDNSIRNENLALAKNQADDYCKLQQYGINLKCLEYSKPTCEIDYGVHTRCTIECEKFEATAMNYTSSIVFENQTFSCVDNEFQRMGYKTYDIFEEAGKYFVQCDTERGVEIKELQISSPFEFGVLY